MFKPMKPAIYALVTLLLATAILAGCAMPAEPTQAPASQGSAVGQDQGSTGKVIAPKNGKNYVVGVTIITAQHPFFVVFNRDLLAEGQAQGVDVRLMDPQMDVNKQISQIEDMIQQNVDLIMILPIDTKAVVPGIEKANAAGIPVMVVDRRSDGGKYIGYVSSDNVAIGRMAANYIATRLNGQGKIAVMEGETGAGPTVDRNKGFDEVISQYPGIEIVLRQSGSFLRDKGMSITENWLQTGKQIDAIFYENDAMAGGGVEAIAAAGKTGEILVVGCDAQKDMFENIKAGKADATFVYPPQSGKEGLKVALQYLKGEPFEPVTMLPTALVNAGNVDYWMKQGSTAGY
jgi:ribose transport system substrate-binding protein